MINDQLDIPKSIIILRNDDPIIQDKLERERKPYLVAGYTIRDYNELPQFSFSATINCHHYQFWDVLIKIIELVSEPIALSIGDYNNLSDLSGSYSQKRLAETLTNYSETISNNTEIQMLFNSQNENSAFQLFVSDCKYFEIYGSDEHELREIMLELSLPEISDLATVDEFPRTMTGEPGDTTQVLLNDIKNALEKT